MNLESLKSDLERDEGRIPYAYQDSEGYWTCGVGFLIDKRKGARIPDAVIDFWLDYEVQARVRTLETVFTWWHTLDEARKEVIANMAYQLGVTGVMEFKRMLMALQEHDYDKAADEMADSHWAKQTPERAQRLITSMRTGQ